MAFSKLFFWYRYGTFEYLVKSMGLINAPSKFFRAINYAYFDLLDDCVIIYLDDFLISCRTKEEHFTDINLVFSHMN